MISRAALIAALLSLAACGGESTGNKADANAAGDPYGATGAPGADMTDNGAGDASNGLADVNRN